MTLPFPELARWVPLRLGLVNLYHYEAEEFWLRDGHLLLRGNNGTGKSKVLALTLPFLLDGDHSAARVEPDGDPGKRMEWNLLLDGLHEQRVGYSWVEFGRRDGTDKRFLTLVCGLKAAAGRGVTGKWFAVVDDLRIGEGLHLVDANRLVLEKDRLREAVGTAGTLHDRVGSYRDAVRERLFGIPAERYDALLRLLLQLRQPQLSKRPDEAALATALTEALPPLDEAIVAHVATAMAGLEDDREELRQLQQIQRVVAGFHGRYRRYARVAVRRASDRVRQTNSLFEELARERRAAEGERDEAVAESGRHAEAIEEAARAGREARATVGALRMDPTMLEARRLHDAETAARQAHDVALRAERALGEARDDLRRRRRAGSEADAAAEQAHEEAARREEEAALAADAAGVGPGHREVVAVLIVSTPPRDVNVAPADVAGAPPTLRPTPDPARLAGAERDATRVAEDRRRALRRVREEVRTAGRAHAAAIDARGRRDDAESERAEAELQLQAAQERLAERGHALLAAAEAWAAATTQLRLRDLAGTLAATEIWVQDPVDDVPLRRAAEEAARERGAVLAVERAAVERRRGEARAALGEVEAEQERLARGVSATPPVSPVRPHRDDARTGAPLWRVLEFDDAVEPAARAGLEAALEAGGLLDAWVTPDGALLDPRTLDAVVAAGPPVASSLASVLRASLDEGAVAPDVVARLLASIGLGPSTAETWVDVNGRYRVGALEGTWVKDEARYVGAAAREAERRRRLAALEVEAERLRGDVAAANRMLRAVSDGLATLDAERGGIPSGEPVRGAAGEVDLGAAGLRIASTKAEHAARAAAQSAAVAQQADATRERTAAELRLPADEAGLAEVEEAVLRYRERVAALWPAVREEARAARQATAAAGELSEAERREAERAGHAARDLRAAEDAQTTARVLRQTIGAAVDELQRRLAAAERDVDAAEARGRVAVDERLTAEATRATAEERVRQLDVRVGEADERRRAAAGTLESLARLGLLRAAAPDVEHPLDARWAVDPTVRAARRLDAELDDIEDVDAAWARESTRITAAVTDLQTALSAQGASASAEFRDDAYVVAVTYRGVHDTPDGILAVLDDEVAYSQRILDEREREVLENHLVAEVASHLVDRLRTAEELVLAVNAQLEARPTSTGMRLRLRWEESTGAPEGLAEAKKRLRARTGVWSADERQAVGAFLKRCLDDERRSDEGASWSQTLGRAFDYRRWHTYAVLRSNVGEASWRRAAGPASGGERVLAMTLPLFAAASAFYDGAVDHAPRLVLLDEAFAGVDRAARAACLGLLDVFNLDYVLTSESEWGTYRDVRGLAICQLVRRPGVDAVWVSRWWWDGEAREPAAYATGSAVAPAPVRSIQDETLFRLES